MLKKDIEHYLAVRRALGYDLKTTESLLNSFADFACERGDTYVISDSVFAWAERSTTSKQRKRRLNIVIRFAQFMHAEDSHHQIPSNYLYQSREHRSIPYIFTDEEFQRLLAKASQLGPSGSLRPHTYYTLFGLLIATGMRISEVLTLEFDDFTNDGLIVRETKFNKSRLLPLHDSTTSALEHYLQHRHCFSCNDRHLFISLRGKQLSYAIVRKTFLQLCSEAALIHPAGKPKLKIHHIRHTFAVRALERGPHDRQKVTAHMVALMTYMGHASIQSTYWYLHSTPQLMQDIASAAQSYIEGVTL